MTRVKLAQASDPRQPWLPTLMRPGSPQAAAEDVAEGWIAVACSYAGAKGYIDPELALRAVPRFPGDNDRWLPLWSSLAKGKQNAIAQAPVKQQLYWHLLPLALALGYRRAPDLSLTQTVAPRWQPAPADAAEAAELMWLYTHEGLYGPRTPIAVLPDDPYLQGNETPDPSGLVVVNDVPELFEFVHDTAVAGYAEPSIEAYGKTLSRAGITVGSRPLRASVLAALTSVEYGKYQQGIAPKVEVPEPGPRFRTRADAARRTAFLAAEARTLDIGRYLGQRPGYRGVMEPVLVQASHDPDAVGVMMARECCLAHGGVPNAPVSQARECSNCKLNYPKGRPTERGVQLLATRHQVPRTGEQAGPHSTNKQTR